MTVKNDTSDLAAQVEDLTEMLNRVRSVIRAAGVDRSKELDPRGFLDMTREEYQAEMDKLQEISDKHEARRNFLAEIAEDELDDLIVENQIKRICDALKD